jgi:hypothetical protein
VACLPSPRRPERRARSPRPTRRPLRAPASRGSPRRSSEDADPEHELVPARCGRGAA